LSYSQLQAENNKLLNSLSDTYLKQASSNKGCNDVTKPVRGTSALNRAEKTKQRRRCTCESMRNRFCVYFIANFEDVERR